MVGMCRFHQAAEDHLGVLREAGLTPEEAARELADLAKSLAAEGQYEFAEALLAVRREAKAKVMKPSAAVTRLIVSQNDNADDAATG